MIGQVPAKLVEQRRDANSAESLPMDRRMAEAYARKKRPSRFEGSWSGIENETFDDGENAGLYQSRINVRD